MSLSESSTPSPPPPSLGERRALAIAIAGVVSALLAASLLPGGLTALAVRLSSDGQLSPSNLRVVRAASYAAAPTALLLLAVVVFYRTVARLLRRILDLLARVPTTVFFAVVLTLAGGLRLLWVFAVPSLPVTDFLHYHELAVSLVETGRYSDVNGQPTAFWPPGYPALLALLYAIAGKTYWAPKLLNVALGVLTVVLTYFLAQRFAGEACARLAALILSVFPSQIAYTSLLCTEIPFTAIMTGLLLAVSVSADRQKHRPEAVGLALGALISAAMMMRPQIALFPLITWWLLTRRRGWGWSTRFHLTLAIVPAAAILFWGLRNVRAVGGFVPFSTNAGLNFYYGNNPWTNGTGFEFWGQVPDQTAHIASEVERNREGFRLGFTFIRDHPEKAVVLAARKIVMMLLSDGTWTRLALLETERALPKVLWPAAVAVSNVVYWPVLFLFALEMLVFRWRRHARASADRFLDAFVIYTLLITAAWLGQERYHFPLIPAMCTGAAILLGRVAALAVPAAPLRQESAEIL
ncbi:MAG: glycosyltransferase family 39 protein [Candidatus Sumerlaeia bacterium]|nr:glycosyltransferase family 39 protein [Candidatus Sumerlaeia bacterium]